MPRIHRILCPVDFSDAHRDVVRFALDLGRGLNAIVQFLYVVPDLGIHLPFNGHESDVMKITSELTSKAEEKMETLLGSAGQDIRVEGSVVYGYPAEAIIGMAQESECDLIAMGTHGRTGMDRVFFGSVANQVLKNAPIPVLTIRPKQ